MNRYLMILRNVKLWMVLLLSIPLYVQGQLNLPTEETAYYYDVNASNSRKAYEVQDHLMNIKYFDKYGQTTEFTLRIYDWQRKEVSRLQLDKTYGLNHYTVRLTDSYSGWEFDKLYMCEFQDEGRKKYVWPIKLVEPPETEGPEINVIVNPLNLTCDDISQSQVEFYGEIRGGKAPFTTIWYIMDNSRSGFLYQPKEEKLTASGKTPVVLVDSKPDYYVMLYVKDACGSIEQKMVHLICEEKKKRINTLFIEPLTTPETPSQKSK